MLGFDLVEYISQITTFDDFCPFSIIYKKTIFWAFRAHYKGKLKITWSFYLTFKWY